MTQPSNPEPSTTDRTHPNWAPWIFFASYALGIILAVIDINTRH